MNNPLWQNLLRRFKHSRLAPKINAKMLFENILRDAIAGSEFDYGFTFDDTSTAEIRESELTPQQRAGQLQLILAECFVDQIQSAAKQLATRKRGSPDNQKLLGETKDQLLAQYRLLNVPHPEEKLSRFMKLLNETYRKSQSSKRTL